MKIDPEILKDLVYPAVVAILAAVFSYIATYKLKNKDLQEDKRLKRIDLIDKLQIEITKLLSSFDKLNDDAEKKNFFVIATIQNTKPTIDKLKDLSEDITLFSDDKLRQNILENIDIAATLIGEIETLEMNPVLGYQELERITKEREAEYRSFAMKLLDMGIYFDNNLNSFQYIDNATSDKKGKKVKLKPVAQDNKLQTTQNILMNLVKDINDSQTKLNQLNQENQNKRSYFAIRILNSQTKLRELLNLLSEVRSDLITH